MKHSNLTLAALAVSVMAFAAPAKATTLEYSDLFEEFTSTRFGRSEEFQPVLALPHCVCRGYSWKCNNAPTATRSKKTMEIHNAVAKTKADCDTKKADLEARTIGSACNDHAKYTDVTCTWQ